MGRAPRFGQAFLQAHQGLHGLLPQGFQGLGLLPPGKGAHPALAVDAVFQGIVLQRPGLFLPDRREGGFQIAKHILLGPGAELDAIQRQQQAAHQAVPQDGLLVRQVVGDAVIPEHARHQGGIGLRLRQHHRDVFRRRSRPQGGQDALGCMAQFLKGGACGVQVDMLRLPLIGLSPQRQQMAFQMGQVRVWMGLRLLPAGAEGNARLHQGLGQEAGASAHRGEGVPVCRLVLVHHQGYQHLGSPPRAGGDQPDQRLGQNVKAIDKKGCPAEKIAVLKARQHLLLDVLMVRGAAGQKLLILLIDQGQVMQLARLGQVPGIHHHLRQQARPLELRDGLGHLAGKAGLPGHLAIIL